MEIGNLPLEFNTRARALAQRAINRTGYAVDWRDPLTDEQIYKVIDRGGMYAMPAYEERAVSAETKEAVESPYLPPPAIEMIPVESSNLKGFGHDGEKTLRVWFLNGTAYDYVGIEEGKFFDLVNAPSAGKAYNALVKETGIKGIKL